MKIKAHTFRVPSRVTKF